MVIVREGIARFRFFRPSATRVFLSGDFNDWRTDQLLMSRSADGYWEAKLRLPDGCYQFGYVADGQWYVDYASFGVEAGPVGLRSLLRIAPDSRYVG
ncbi:MAG: glycogen-binding domain-containing protein [Phycisphaerae bacterium]|jgi:1,4-alpha-glucan branching enzyme